ncbi:MAG TPA: hypothetical protein V6D46_10510 [Coleofasciculaceae cyanobacterium]
MIKVIFPTLWITGFGLGTLAMWLIPNVQKPAPLSIKVSFAIAWILGILLLYFTCIRLKSVELDEADRAVYIGNLRATARVPIALVDPLLVGSWGGRPPILTLRLKEPCRFGRSISFVPNIGTVWVSQQRRAVERFVLETNARFDRLR